MIQIPLWAGFLIAFLLVVVVIFATWAYLTAQRLHRMHKRVNRAAISLVGCLDRRAVAVRGVARSMRRAAEDIAVDDPDNAAQIKAEAAALIKATELAEATSFYQSDALSQRENYENDLTLLLKRTDFHFIGREEAEELQDAVSRLALARSFYNNSVREALSLHNAPLIRALHLEGRSEPPQFFNIVVETQRYEVQSD